MLKTSPFIFQPNLKRIASKSLIVGLLSTTGLLFGIIPELRGDRPIVVLNSSSAYAQQAISDEEVQKFARAAYAIERKRLSVSDEVKKRSGSIISGFVCNQLDTVSPDIRSLVVDFCNFSRQTIESSGLTVQRFNQIMTQRESDPDLKRRIDAAIRGLQ
jgi:glutathione peroxidase-family protein